MRSECSAALGYYVPIPQQIKKEVIALAVMGAEEFVEACLCEALEASVSMYVDTGKTRYPASSKQFRTGHNPP